MSCCASQCCSKPCGKPRKSNASCLGRCDLPKHQCLERGVSSKKSPVPSYMGWHYTAKGSPEHQLRCGWRPGHIFCPVLRKIEQHHGLTSNCPSCCSPCVPSSCSKPCIPRSCSRPCTRPCSPAPCPKPSCTPSRCFLPCYTPCCTDPPSIKPVVRITRHAGQFTISTEPADISNAPGGPYPLKYVLNTDDEAPAGARYSIEAKFNDIAYDYTSSEASFILDFTPPEPVCRKEPMRPPDATPSTDPPKEATANASKK